MLIEQFAADGGRGIWVKFSIFITTLPHYQLNPSGPDFIVPRSLLGYTTSEFKAIISIDRLRCKK